MDIIIISVFLLFGIGLIILEVFFLPGITVAGVGAILFLGGAVFYAFTQMSEMAGYITLASTVILSLLAIVFFIRSKTLDKVSLHAEISSISTPDIDSIIKEGDEGITLTRLNPIGNVMVDNEIVEAKTLDELIEENTPIVVLKVNRTNITVSRKKEHKIE